MAFEEPRSPPPQYASPLMALEGMTLFALLLQFASGGVSVYYGLPNALTSMGLISYISLEPTVILFLVSWFGLSIIAWVQLYFGYRMYKKEPGAVNGAIMVNVIALILYVLDIIASASISILFLMAYPQVLIFFAVNLITLLLLFTGSVKAAFAPDYSQPSPGTEYGTYQNW